MATGDVGHAHRSVSRLILHACQMLTARAGKMLDLEALSETCERLGRWSFFLTAAPLRGECSVASRSSVLLTPPVAVPGGVSSPANMIAIF